MSTQYFSVLTILAGVAAPAAFADSIACVQGTVTSIANMSCTIGGLLYTFGSAAIQNPDNLLNLTTDSFLFTPDAAENGFVLSGTIAGTTGTGGRDGLDLGARYSTLDGVAWTTGITTGFTGSTVGGNGNGTAFTQFFQYDASNSDNFLITDPGLANDSTSCNIGAGSSGTFSCTRTYPKGMVAATTALAGLTYGIIDDVGSSTISSADFFVTGTEPPSIVPEPGVGTLAVAGLGLMVVGRFRRRTA
jgi:hypothetical protein